MKLRDHTSKIAVSSDATLVFETQVLNFLGILERKAGGHLSGESVLFDNGIFIDSSQRIRLTGQLGSDESQNILLDGNKTYRGFGQIINRNIHISNDNNRLEGEVILTADIELLDGTSSFTYAVTRSMDKNIILNNGTLYLEEDLRFVADKFIQGPGKVILNNRRLVFGAQDVTCDTPLYFDNAGNILLSSHTYLNETWTFSGQENFIFGNGNILFLGPSGNIVLERGSLLEFVNITIHGLAQNNLACSDDASVLIFDNCRLLFTENFNFSYGSMFFKTDIIFSGTTQFNYLSSQVSTIDQHTQVLLDHSMKFYYNPVVDRSDLIQFTDETSVFCLRGSSLITGLSGMTLTKGSMIVDRNATLFAENATTGFVFGSGDSADDFTCQILAGSLLSLTGGSLYYNNVNPSSWNMIHSTSFFAIQPSTLLHLYQSLDLGRGQLELSNFGYLEKEDGVIVSGSVNIVA